MDGGNLTLVMGILKERSYVGSSLELERIRTDYFVGLCAGHTGKGINVRTVGFSDNRVSLFLSCQKFSFLPFRNLVTVSFEICENIFELFARAPCFRHTDLALNTTVPPTCCSSLVAANQKKVALKKKRLKWLKRLRLLNCMNVAGFKHNILI